ncbi:aminotransferase class I/II-fold pyridoxal phosphate-dependent enzyme [Leucothrix pacifica]|uniref:Aminotransferase n=1 Tax=Leucothrix pacifica TaxID=1247513 RepID=A0A317C2F5_9GAMM|nr:aminotransferase class I/II-fold pyridoxal phosphate-dependent enzyme [Leucothrix pacifica]PWQ92537.1 aminotransferase [Leucothrix pacifica]
MDIKQASPDQLIEFEQQLSAEYYELQAQNLSLNLTRGKPSAEQLTLSDALDGILNGNYQEETTDTRNYGGLRGIMGARQLGADLMGTDVENTMAAGNSSLSLMYMVQLNQYLYGCCGEASAWKHLTAPKMLCPVPGYDRHFSISENLGIEMINVPMTNQGPDMDEVEHLLQSDDEIIGMWCVPKYSNPTGTVYSDETVDRIAALGKIAHPSFRVMWDNAYAVHDLVAEAPILANITERCKAHGTEDSVWQFASTSKITFAGAGVSFLHSSAENMGNFEQLLGVTTIGADKVNQLRTTQLIPDMQAMYLHMQKHRKILAPKFDIVLSHLANDLGHDFAKWTKPQGGYFVSLDVKQGLAKTVVELADACGVKLTSAGAPFPYGKDPDDTNIRIAPSFPPLQELEQAMKVLTTCVKLATVRQLLVDKS